MAKKYGLFYHGTCADHLDDVLKNGLHPVPGTERIWNDSYPNRVYLWGHDRCTELEDREAKTTAIESAEFTLGMAKDCRIIVIEAKVPLSEVWEDNSGVNMDGAFETEEVPVKWITNVWVSQDLSLFKGYFFGMALASSNFRAPCELTWDQKVAVRMYKELDGFFLGDHLDIKLTPAQLPWKRKIKQHEDTEREAW